METGDPVERRLMRQWMLKITAYADRLLEDIEDVDWPEGIKEMQRNWIGKSEGVEVDFCIKRLRGFVYRFHNATGYTVRCNILRLCARTSVG